MQSSRGLLKGRPAIAQVVVACPLGVAVNVAGFSGYARRPSAFTRSRSAFIYPIVYELFAAGYPPPGT